MDYTIISKTADERRTFGPLYVPGVDDAHNEFATAAELRKGVKSFLDGGDRRLRNQHGRETVGDVMGIVQWPFPVEAEMTVPGQVRKSKVSFPADTVFVDVQWDANAWPLVKSGKLAGFSMGGRAVRVNDHSPGGLRKSRGGGSLVLKALSTGLTEQGTRLDANSPGAVQHALASANPNYRRVTFNFDGPNGPARDPGDGGLVATTSDAMVSDHPSATWECLPGYEDELAAALDDLRDQFREQMGREPTADDTDFQMHAARLMLKFSANQLQVEG